MFICASVAAGSRRNRTQNNLSKGRVYKMKGKYEQPTVRIVGIAQRDLISTSVESTKDFNRDWLDSVGDTPGETV